MPMAEAPPEQTPAQPPTVLDSIRVLDWTDQSGAYASRLLADLGADVVRVEPAADSGPWPEERVPSPSGPG
jgi:crotonobetainyl-CoA:carnitine CoA-transferase CaiB-like acyl-CoA transferase